MSRRYQVFLSSTYTDLQDARSEAIQALLELDCMPAGMELFPAANEQQWNWIKKIIDESDYYVAIVAGRYGTMHPSRQIGYTEMEYRYAVESGKPVLAFLHEDPSQIPNGNCEATPEGRERLASFRRLCEGKLCKYWNSPTDLAAKLSRSLTQLIKHEPRGGWIKSNNIDGDTELELLKLREENNALRVQLTEVSAVPIDVAELASGSDLFELEFHCEAQLGKVNKSGSKYWVKGRDIWDSIGLTWDQLFFAIIPALTGDTSQRNVYSLVNSLVTNSITPQTLGLATDERIFQVRLVTHCGDQIRMQFTALGFITIEVDGYELNWVPTLKGRNQIIKLAALKKGETHARLVDDIVELSDPTFEQNSAPSN